MAYVTGNTILAHYLQLPYVPGVGEQHTGPCEPKAYVLRVTAPGSGTVAAPINPPTAVCERGGLSFTVYQSAG